MEDRKVLLSVKDLQVKFKVRGRILTAIRGVSLDIYENESIAIVGESGSGKSVFVKTFAGMLDDNGYISEGDIIYNDPDLSETVVAYTDNAKKTVNKTWDKLNEYSKFEFGAETYSKILNLKKEKEEKMTLSPDEYSHFDEQIKELEFKKTEEYNLRQTFDPKKERDKINNSAQLIKDYEKQIQALTKEKDELILNHKKNVLSDTEYLNSYKQKLNALEEQYAKEIDHEISEATKERNLVIAKEIYLSVGRYDFTKRMLYIRRLIQAFKKAMLFNSDLNNDNVRNNVFDTVVFRVKYIDETDTVLHGTCVLNLAKIKYTKDWQQIRGTKVATVFQDPMSSLNPILTIGKQISAIIMKHQKCSEAEARIRAIELMHKVGIPNAENRFDDYPFQYSGGMRQRIVIAIALSCQPKILICDEPTTALDVTIQAQILKLIKDLQKEFNYTIVFITHDLGVVANIADRVAVLYAGQIVELGSVEEVFYDPRHPYTWALLSSLPQLATKDQKLYSITGTPPSLYNKIVGDPFAPRNPYCLKIDTLVDSPMFQVSETHFAKTWLLDPRAPKIEKPEAIQNIHEKLMKAFNI